MRAVSTILLVLAFVMVAGRVVAMLPPETFKDPIFAAAEDQGNEDGGGETDFA